MYTTLYTTFNNWLQSVPTDYRLDSLIQLPQQLVTVHRPATQPFTTGQGVPATQPFTTGQGVPATQPCTLASTTGFRVYLQVLTTQPCTLVSTYRLQSLLTGCWLHSPYCTVLHPNWLHIYKKKK